VPGSAWHMGQLSATTKSHSLFNPSAGSRETDGLAQKDKEQNDGQTHGKIGDASRPLGAAREAGPDEKPRESTVSDIGTDNARGPPVRTNRTGTWSST